MSTGTLVIIILAVVVVVLAIAAISIRSQRSNTIEDRLGRYTDVGMFLDLPKDEGNDKEARPKKESGLSKSLEGFITGRGFAKNWQEQLSRADLKLKVHEYMAVHVISMVGMALLAYIVLFPAQIVQTIILGGIGLFIPRIYVSNRMARRLKKFESQLPDTLGLWVNALRSGYSVLQALEAISREAPPPTNAELKRIVREVQLGIRLPDALDHLLERMPSEDLDLIITAVDIQIEVGGNLAEILEVINHTIRERIKLKGEIAVLTAQGRITGWLISGLPIVLALFLMIINPHYMGELFTNRPCGWPMIGIGLGMIGTGAALIQKIVDIEI